MALPVKDKRSWGAEMQIIGWIVLAGSLYATYHLCWHSPKGAAVTVVIGALSAILTGIVCMLILFAVSYGKYGPITPIEADITPGFIYASLAGVVAGPMVTARFRLKRNIAAMKA